MEDYYKYVIKRDRRDPDYVSPKFTDEEVADMYAEHVEEERKEQTVQEREIISTEEIF